MPLGAKRYKQGYSFGLVIMFMVDNQLYIINEKGGK